MSKKKRRPRANRHFRIDHELRPEDRAAYLAFLREPQTTIKSAHAWLAGRGYADLSESAVARHMRHSLAGFEQQRAAEQFSLHLAELAGREGGDHALLRGAVVRLDQLILDATFDLRPETEGATPADLREFADVLGRLVDLRRQLGEIEAAAARATPAGEAEREREVKERIGRILNRVPGARPGAN